MHLFSFPPRRAKIRRGFPGIALSSLFLGAFFSAALAVAHATDSAALADLSLEELMNESVTSVSKKATRLDESPAAITVISNDDIRRLGITSIPEALRLVPGMDVARITANRWAVSARGFNTEFAGKLLVLIDGRSVYNPSFSGVFWDAQDLVLEDLDRIEVIRGPGAALWGANAVNGVVNIITKGAKETQGMLFSSVVGTEEQPSTSLRYGGQLGPHLFYRAYLKYFNRAGFVDSEGRDAHDAWNSARGGFRLDWEPFKTDSVTLQGDYYRSEIGGRFVVAELTPPFSKVLDRTSSNMGANVLGRWTHRFSESSQLTIQSFYDHSTHQTVASEINDVADLDIQHRFALGSRNDIVWGLGYRHSVNEIPRSSILLVTPRRRAFNLYTAFLQDQITLVSKRLSLILGSKFEHNDYTGFEIQPNGRLLWTPDDKQTFWAGVSRAVRTPSRVETTRRYSLAAFQPSPFAPPVEVVSFGNPGQTSEIVLSYELGYRVRPVRQLSLDLAAFYNVYDRLIDPNGIPGELRFEGDRFVQPINGGNTQSGESYGVELSVQWKVTERWRLISDYSWLKLQLRPEEIEEKGSPQQQFRLRSYLDRSVAYVDRIVENTTGQAIPAYVRADIGLVWRPRENLEVGIWGQNLLDNRHPEFGDIFASSPVEVPRSVLGRITWRF